MEAISSTAKENSLKSPGAAAKLIKQNLSPGHGRRVTPQPLKDVFINACFVIMR